MKLKTLLSGQQEQERSLLIGREIEILEERVLLLGLMEAKDAGEDGTETITKLLMLYEEKEPEEDWDDEENWDDEECLDENKTNRQVLIEWMEEVCEPEVTDLTALFINGTRYEADELCDVSMDERPYEEVLMLKALAERKAIPGYWMNQDLELLGLAEYEVDAAMWDVAWDADILSITAEMGHPGEEVLIGKVTECPIGHYDQPMEFAIRDREGKELLVKIYGVYLENIWEDEACLEFEFSELEELCHRDERLLVLDYSVQAPNLQLNFFPKERLDAKAYPDGELTELYDIPVAESPKSRGIIGSSVGRCVLDVVSEDFDQEAVEVELLSYAVLED